MRDPFVIAGHTIHPGHKVTINIPIPKLYTHSQMSIPVHIIHGKQEGPRLFVCAAIHGDEILGVEIIRRVMKMKKVRKIKGTLITIPVVNVFGFINQSRYLPDRRDLNRCFPGSEKGSLTSRLADIFIEEVISHCTHGIDLHTGSNHRKNLPQIRASLDDPATKAMAMAFRAPVLIHSTMRDSSLRQTVHEQGIPILLYEAGEALRFDEVAIRAGARGVLSVMSFLNMLPSRKEKPNALKPVICVKTSWVRAPVSGISNSMVPLGRSVTENSVIGKIADPFSDSEVPILAPLSGIIIGRLNLPLVYQGDAIVHIAKVKDPDAVESAIEDFEQEMEAPI